MESSILSEGCKHLDSQDGALQCYYYPLNRLPASRLLLPRSGLERSDFVRWPERRLPAESALVSAARGNADSFCSARAFPGLPRFGHAALPKAHNELARVVDFLPCRSRKDDVRSAGGCDAAGCGMAPEAWSRAIRSPLFRERHYLCD